MPRYLRTRFAPAPTGYLHLGHIVNALAVWGVARAVGAEVALRIEDHDRQRCRPEYETALREDLEWLGLLPDVGPSALPRIGASPWRQSDNTALYAAALDQLRAAGHQVYACDCSRSTLAAGDAAADANGERRYAGRCRERELEPTPDRGIRVVLAPGEECFDDIRLGGQRQNPAAQCGDLLLRDRHGNWTYQFAVVVDDLRHGIDLVIRGEDLLGSTGRQLRLGRMLGRRQAPAFLHHTLIRKPDGDKLSKGSGDTSVRELRQAGLRREALLGRALRLAQWSPSEAPIALEEAVAVAGREAATGGRIPRS